MTKVVTYTSKSQKAEVHSGPVHLKEQLSIISHSTSSRLNMSYYGNIDTFGKRGMEVEYEEMVNSSDIQTESEYSGNERHRTPTNKVGIRNYRAAVVCLVLLCVLLLTAVIALCVHIHTIRTNCTQERDEVITEKENLSKERDQLPDVVKDQCSGNPKWITHKHSSYYISSEWKNWTESRQDCLQRGADLIIVNDKEEQDFITAVTSANIVWIGLNELHKEGIWKWVDGSPLTTAFWRHGEPNNRVGDEDCTVSHFHWADYPCDFTFVWICEKDLEV